MREIKVDINVLEFIRDRVEELMELLIKNSEINSGMVQVSPKIIRQTLENNFILQLLNMMENFNLFQINNVDESEYQFVGYSLYDERGKLIPYELVGKEKSWKSPRIQAGKMSITFEESTDNSILQIPNDILKRWYILPATPHYLMLSFFMLDKGKVTKLLIKRILNQPWNKIVEGSTTVDKEKTILIARIKAARKEMDKWNKRALASELGYKESTFNDLIRNFRIKYNKKNKSFTDLDTGEVY